jgi:DNA mismatch endonuclease (patch repair protein)
MTDIYSTEKRSEIMAKIKSKDTAPEIKLRRELHRLGLRYFVNNELIGRPDIVFPRKKVVIFVDGDFWHGYLWKEKNKIPKRGYWRKKISKNIENDKIVEKKLAKLGWKVIRVWEHEINRNIGKCIGLIFKYLK